MSKPLTCLLKTCKKCINTEAQYRIKEDHGPVKGLKIKADFADECKVFAFALVNCPISGKSIW